MVKTKTTRKKRTKKRIDKKWLIMLIIVVIVPILIGFFKTDIAPGKLDGGICESFNCDKEMDPIAFFSPGLQEFLEKNNFTEPKTQYTLWLVNNGKSDLHITDIDVVVNSINNDVKYLGEIGRGNGYWAKVLGEKQFKLEPNQENKIPLRIEFDDDYWKNTTLKSNSEIYIEIDVDIKYRAKKNKELSNNIKKRYPVDIKSWSGFNETS